MSRSRILVVEDEPINRETLTENLGLEGYEVLAVSTGEAAWSLVSADPGRFDVILLDRMMPDIDGIEVLRRLKAHPELVHTPVIMQTAMTADRDVSEGLRAGAYYYLTKPFSAETLLAIVAAAVADCREYRELRNEAGRDARNFSSLKSACFTFRTPEQARSLATLLANAAPDPGKVVIGLSELMLNAIEHGNLGISYDEKGRLIEAGTLEDEISRRLDLPGYGERHAEVLVERRDDLVSFLISDQGLGFDWRRYLEMSPDRAFDTHGRGIALSRLLSFDRVEYRGCGNQVQAFVTLD